MRAQPWQASPAEALTMKGGFADQTGFWSTLWNAIMFDVPTGLDQIDCPVIVAQGAMDVIGSGQTPRFTPLIPGARFALLPGAGHAPQSDAPQTIIDLVHRAADQATEHPAAAGPWPHTPARHGMPGRLGLPDPSPTSGRRGRVRVRPERPQTDLRACARQLVIAGSLRTVDRIEQTPRPTRQRVLRSGMILAADGQGEERRPLDQCEHLQHQIADHPGELDPTHATFVLEFVVAGVSPRSDPLEFDRLRK